MVSAWTKATELYCCTTNNGGTRDLNVRFFELY
jgi:hypothetical protein